MFKKLWALMLAVAMLLTCVVPMAAFAEESAITASADAVGTVKSAFSDVAESPYISEINLLNAISVLAGDPDGTFRPTDTISRAEMAAIIVRISGMEASVAAGETEFEDVPSSHWASGYIKIASSLDVINGDGNGKFRPDDDVTYNEAVKMLVCVLGYGVKAVEVGPWPTGYLVTADDLKLNDEVLVQTGKASRETVAKLVANSLDIDYLEKVGFGDKDRWVATAGKTLLSEKLKVTKIEDIVTESSLTSTVGTGALRNHEVKINDIRYYVGETDIAKYVGYPVVAYAKLDKSVDKEVSTIVYYELDTENVAYIEIDGDDIHSATSSVINVFESEESAKTKKYQIAPAALKIVNNVGDMGYDLSSLDPNNRGNNVIGEVIMIDKDEDDVIETIFVSVTQTYVVSSLRKANNGFYILAYDLDGDSSNDRLPATGKFDLEDITLKLTIEKDGKEISYKDIQEYNVISYTTDGNNIHKLVVSDETVTGKVEKILTTTGKIVVEGNEYEYADVLPHSKKGNVGDALTLYLDQFGKVAYTTKDSSSVADDYAYMIGLGQDGLGTINANEWQIKVYTNEDGAQVLSFADNVSFINNGVTNANNSGNPYNEQTLATGLTSYGLLSSGVAVPQVIKFATNSEGKVTAVETAITIPSSVVPTAQTNEQASVFRRNLYDGDGSKFYAHLAGFSTSSTSAGKKNYVYTGAQLLFMPLDASGNVIEEDIAFAPATMFFNGNGNASHSVSDFELYDCDQDGNIGLIVAKLPHDSAEYKQPRNTTLYIVSDVSTSVVDGEKMVRISGYSAKYKDQAKGITTFDMPYNTTCLNSTISAAKATAADIKPGDIITLTVMPNGKVYAYNLYYSVLDDLADGTFTGGGISASDSSYTTSWYSGSTLGSVAAGTIVSNDVRNGKEFITFRQGTDVVEFDLNEETGFALKLDVAKGELTEMDIADLPLPETLEDGTVLQPKVILRGVAGSGDMYLNANLIYVDDGTF